MLFTIIGFLSMIITVVVLHAYLFKGFTLVKGIIGVTVFGVLPIAIGYINSII